MIIYPNIRLYAQMKPDDDGVSHLADVQRQLPKQARGRAVSLKQLHMTLIHFGKVYDVYEILQQKTGISYDEYAIRLKYYIQQTNILLPTGPAIIQPKGFARYGQRGGTLVIEYDVPTWIIEAHGKLVGVLRQFFDSCGVKNIDEFMTEDINFMHASELKAHITIYKGYTGSLPEIELRPVRIFTTPLVYPPLNQ